MVDEPCFAVFYDRPGPAAEVLQFGQLAVPEPGPGEVRVRLTRSGINPGDTKSAPVSHRLPKKVFRL
jgi:NADPH:quinone reductase-like Zn-dependent oxidoreductase